MSSDRHGRVWRVDGDARHRPPDGFRARDRERFTRLCEEALAELPDPLRELTRHAELIVRDLPATPPPRDVDPDEVDVPLVAVRGDEGGVEVMLVYRRLVEVRAVSRADLVMLLRDTIIERVASAFGLDPYDWLDED